jgi:hypothetical protein
MKVIDSELEPLFLHEPTTSPGRRLAASRLLMQNKGSTP